MAMCNHIEREREREIKIAIKTIHYVFAKQLSIPIFEYY